MDDWNGFIKKTRHEKNMRKRLYKPLFLKKKKWTHFETHHHHPLKTRREKKGNSFFFFDVSAEYY